MTDEIPSGARMTKFASCGPKFYAYEYEYINENGQKVTVAPMKIKGVSATSSVLDVVDFESIWEMAVGHTEGQKISHNVPQMRFVVDGKTHMISTLPSEKLCRVVSDKRRIIGNDTLPYGYVN